MCPAARNVWDTEGGLMAKNDKNYKPSASLRVSMSAPVGDLDLYLWVYILSKLKPRSV